MDREFLTDLFSAFGPVTLRRMFSGYGVSVDGVTFALVLRGMVHFRVDEQTVARFEEEGVKPFQYDARGKTVTIASYWQLPARLYDDPEELAEWARLALGAAERAAAKKRARGKSKKSAKAVSTKTAKAKPSRTGKTRGKTSASKTSGSRTASAAPRRKASRATTKRASRR
jgi:DNA transformation protein and related proteins